MKNNRRLTIDISYKTILAVLFSFLAFQFISNIISVIILLFTAILVVIAVNPLVNLLSKRNLPRPAASLLVLFVILTTLSLLIAMVITPLLSQTQVFLQRLPGLTEEILPFKLDFQSLSPQLFSFRDQFFKLAASTFSGVLSILTVVVISFYLLQEWPNLKSYLKYLFGSRGELYHHIVLQLESKLGSWVRGELLLMLIVGGLTYVGLGLLGLPYLLALSVIAGLLELVPNIGPTIAAVPAIIVGFSVSYSHGLAALIVAIIVQQLENHLIVPKVMQKATGLNPIITLIALMIGFQLGGPLLAVLALPVFITIEVFVSHLHLDKNKDLPQIS